MRGWCIRLAALALALLAAVPAAADWTEGGNAVSAAVYDQGQHLVVPDGDGGLIVVWAWGENEGGFLKNDIFAQRIDKRGKELWTPGGVALCDYVDEQGYPCVVSDGSGGIIVAWYDYRNAATTWADIYAQRVHADGSVGWTSNGVPVCTAARNQGYPVIAPVDGGGAIVAWQDDRNGTGWDVYAQRLSGDGTPLWTADGVALCTNAAWQEELTIIPYGQRGALVVWEDTRSTTSVDLYGEHVDSSGVAQWGGDGYGLVTELHDQYNPAAFTNGYDNTGYYLVWIDNRGGTADVYAERFSGINGSWGTNGLAVCAAAGNQNYAEAVRYGEYDLVVWWQDNRGSDIDLYAQRLDFFGTVLWTADGEAICALTRDQAGAQAIETAGGDLLFVWSDSRNLYSDLFAQRVAPDGSPRWDEDGISFVDDTYYRGAPLLTPDDEGGAIVAWNDQRDWQTQGQDLYALRLDGSGVWGYPAPAIAEVGDVPDDQGGVLTLAWSASPLDRFPDETITHYSVWRSLSAPAAMAITADGTAETPLSAIGPDFAGAAWRRAPLGAAAAAWEWIGNVEAHRFAEYAMSAATLYDSTASNGGVHHFLVAAHTADPFVWWDSEPDSGWSVDNLAPEPPVGLAGEQLHGPEALSLHWNPNVEDDLAGYRVYRGTEAGFVPGAGNMIAACADTATTDGDWTWDAGFWYKVTALDIHGNESLVALLGPEGVTGGETPAATRTFLAQNRPNPFNPSTTIAFGLAVPGRARIAIYDPAGRLVRLLLDERRAAGRYEIAWDGRDDGGRRAASGVYFCRFTAGETGVTRKMVLLR